MSNHSNSTLAAALVAALPKDVAASLLAKLQPEDTRRLLIAMISDDRSHEFRLSDVVRQFERELASSVRNEDGRENVSGIELGAKHADEMSERSCATRSNNDFANLDFLDSLDDETRCRVLHCESPRQIAKAVAFLDPSVSSRTLERFDPELRSAVIEWMVKSEDVYPEDVAELKNSLTQNLRQIEHLNQQSDLTLSILKKRLPSSSAVLQANANDVENDFEAGPDEPDAVPLLGEPKLFGLTTDDIKLVLTSTDTSLWAPALKNSSDAVKQQVFGCMAPAAAALLKVEIDRLADVSMERENEAKKKIVTSALKLAAQGLVWNDSDDQRAAG